MTTAAPLAVVQGKIFTEAPSALYIPPAALRVVLGEFEGPLDLLLFLIRRHKLDILNIPMTQLCRQYSAYVAEIINEDIELAADYLTMSARLIEIKTKMLLPRPAAPDDEEDDPRADLVQRLLEYEQMRDAAEALNDLPRRTRDFVSPALPVDIPASRQKPQPKSDQLAAAFAAVLRRMAGNNPANYLITREPITIREVMTGLLRRLTHSKRLGFYAVCKPGQGGVTFIALLQMAFEALIHIHQQHGDDDAQEDLYFEMRQEYHDDN